MFEPKTEFPLYLKWASLARYWSLEVEAKMEKVPTSIETVNADEVTTSKQVEVDVESAVDHRWLHGPVVQVAGWCRVGLNLREFQMTGSHCC